jgi:hypothetical protein
VFGIVVPYCMWLLGLIHDLRTNTRKLGTQLYSLQFLFGLCFNYYIIVSELWISALSPLEIKHMEGYLVRIVGILFLGVKSSLSHKKDHSPYMIIQ